MNFNSRSAYLAPDSQLIENILWFIHFLLEHFDSNRPFKK